MVVRAMVVLPAPLRPISATVAPARRSNVTLRSTCTPAIHTLTLLKLSMFQIPITCSRTTGSASTSAGGPLIWILPALHTATRSA